MGAYNFHCDANGGIYVGINVGTGSLQLKQEQCAQCGFMGLLDLHL